MTANPVAAQLETKPEAAKAGGDKDLFDGGAAPYDPSLYAHRGVVQGLQGYDAFAVDSQGGIDRYERDGFLAIQSLLTPAEVDASLAGLLDLIDGKYPEFRHIQFEAGARKLLGTMSPEQKQDVVRKVMHFAAYEPRLRAVAWHPKIVDVVTRLIGEAPALYETKALIKPPRIGREKAWHQDHAYWNLPLGAKVVTVWIALDPATTDNGCLFVIPGSHAEGPVVHFRRRDWQICDDQVQLGRVTAAPLRAGGCLFFNSMLHHGTPANSSVLRRRALQYVYVPASVGHISQEERLAVFGSEGKDVKC